MGLFTLVDRISLLRDCRAIMKLMVKLQRCPKPDKAGLCLEVENRLQTLSSKGAEIQRIKSTGDYDAARKLVEAYAVKVDPELHAEVLERYKKLNLAPYKGFVNPKYEAVTDADGNITDITVTYDEGYAEQMLRYSKDYSVLPSVNN